MYLLITHNLLAYEVAPRQPEACLKVKRSTSIPGAEGNVVNDFARSQNVGKTQQYWSSGFLLPRD